MRIKPKVDATVVVVVVVAVLALACVCSGAHVTAASAAASPVPATLHGVLREGYPNVEDCRWNALDGATGVNTTIRLLSVCKDRQQNSSIARTVATGSGAMLYTTGSGAHVWSIDGSTGVATPVVDIPGGFSDTILAIGLAADGHTFFAVTNAGLCSATANADSPGTLSCVHTFSVPSFGSAAVVGAAHAWISTGTHLLTVSLTTGQITHAVPYAATVLDLEWSASQETLYAVYGYVLYALDPDTADTTAIIDVPDGDGYPGVSCLDDAAGVYYVAGFQHLFAIDIAAKQIFSKVPFDGYFEEGNFAVLSLPPSDRAAVPK